METVDPEISATCKDLAEVKKVFQLALLCTKRQPSERPTMHEVVCVLSSILPAPKHNPMGPTVLLSSSKVSSYMDEYANLKTPHLVNCSSISTSDAQLFLKFGEVISQNIGVFKKIRNRIRNIRNFGYPKIRISENSDIRKFGYPKIG
ncbi:putative non-specific serine/threonine protein kinase [Helianthus anomalus]